MSDIKAAMDEPAVTQVLAVAQATLGTLTSSGTTTFGPFTAAYGSSGSFSGGTVHLFVPNVVQISNVWLNYTVQFNLSFDLSNIIPNLYFPGLKKKIGKKWIVIIPSFTVNWPSVTLPVWYSDSVKFSSNFNLQTSFDGTDWHVAAGIVSVPALQLSPAAGAILVLIGAAAGPALAWIPFLGPFMATAVLGITTTLGVAGVLNLLGVMITPLVSGARFELYRQPKLFQIMPAASPVDPAVFIKLDSVAAAVINSGEPELELSVAVSP